MKENKQNIQKKLTLTLFFFTLFHCIFNSLSFCSDKKNTITYKNNPIEKCSFYQKYNENYCKFLKKFLWNEMLTYENRKKYSFRNPFPLSEIQISNNFLNFKNIYLKNYDQLIFHQLSYQFINQKKICNFGLGYRNYYCTQWIVGNNIFYDTLLSSSENDKKILSIGTELLKDFMHITINTYYDISNNHPLYIKDKKYLPFSYDIYIKNRLPFFKNTHTKINIEHFFNNKHNKKTILLKETNIIKKHPFKKNIYKVTLGFIYIPTSIFTFNIDKIISNSIKNHETKFNIIANYKIHIPWITYQKKEKKNNDQHHINYEKILERHNSEYTIYRNHTMLLLYPLNINIDNIDTEDMIPKNQKYTKRKKNESKKIFHFTNNDPNSHYSKDEDDTISHITISHDTKKGPSTNDSETSSSNKEPYICSEFNEQTHVLSIDTTNMINTQNNSTFINVNDKKSSPNNITIDEIHQKNHTPLIKTNNSDISLFQKSKSQTVETLKIQQKKSEETNIDPNNIPPPPPITFKIFSNDNLHSKNNMNSNACTNNNDNHLNDLKNNIAIINKNKSGKFSSLGSEEHLLKLNNITKKRKKTISTSSNDSNDSESIRLLRIIERQSILTKNNDTDSEDKDSMPSDNDFSE